MDTRHETRREPPRARVDLGGAFWRYWTAWTLSSTGNGMLFVVLPLLGAAATGDPVAVSLIMVAERLPWLLFGLPVGALADRLPARPLLIGADLARMAALVVVGLAALGAPLGLPVLLLTAFVVGAGTVVFDCAAQAWLPRIVDERSLGRANGYLAVGAQSDTMLGPALGGATVAVAPALPVLLDAGTFAGSALLLRRVPKGAPVARRATGGVRAEIRAGLAYLRRDRFVLLLAITLASLAGLQAGAVAVQVLLGLEVFGLTEAQYGVFVGAAAVGGLGGALAGSRLAAPGRVWVLLVAITAATAGYVGLTLTSDPWIGGVALAVENVGIGLGNVAIATLRMGAVPADLQARIVAVFRMFLFTSVSVGALAGGVVADAFGLRAPFLLAAAGYVLLILLVVTRMFRLAPAGRSG